MMRDNLDAEVYAQMALWIGRLGLAFFTMMAVAHFVFEVPIRDDKYGPPIAELKAFAAIAGGFCFFAAWAWFGRKLLSLEERMAPVLTFILRAGRDRSRSLSSHRCACLVSSAGCSAGASA